MIQHQLSQRGSRFLSPHSHQIQRSRISSLSPSGPLPSPCLVGMQSPADGMQFVGLPQGSRVVNPSQSNLFHGEQNRAWSQIPPTSPVGAAQIPKTIRQFQQIPYQAYCIGYEQRQFCQQVMVPVQRKKINYYAIEHVTDYQPREYEETLVEMVPEERIKQKVYYLPIETHLVHFPAQEKRPPPSQHQYQYHHQPVISGQSLQHFSAVQHNNVAHHIHNQPPSFVHQQISNNQHLPVHNSQVGSPRQQPFQFPNTLRTPTGDPHIEQASPVASPGPSRMSDSEIPSLANKTSNNRQPTEGSGRMEQSSSLYTENNNSIRSNGPIMITNFRKGNSSGLYQTSNRYDSNKWNPMIEEEECEEKTNNGFSAFDQEGSSKLEKVESGYKLLNDGNDH